VRESRNENQINSCVGNRGNIVGSGGYRRRSYEEDGNPCQVVKYLVGTMIEIPRAALIADQIAEVAEFFSFRTNDLTQMTFGFSRDDAGKFLPDYLAKKIIPAEPFQTLDEEGVGQLVDVGIKRGRASRPDL
jgi:pyruvate,orthophosphate dikinase